MPKFIVTMKWGARKCIEADDLRAAQDKALRIYGPYVVIYVQESREHPDPEHVYGRGTA